MTAVRGLGFAVDATTRSSVAQARSPRRHIEGACRYSGDAALFLVFNRLLSLEALPGPAPPRSAQHHTALRALPRPAPPSTIPPRPALAPPPSPSTTPPCPACCALPRPAPPPPAREAEFVQVLPLIKHPDHAADGFSGRLVVACSNKQAAGQDRTVGWQLLPHMATTRGVCIPQAMHHLQTKHA